MKFKGALITGAIIFSLVIPGVASAFHCSGGFVYIGDTSLAVMKKCGEPQI